jgi:hypothetical protein
MAATALTVALFSPRRPAMREKVHSRILPRGTPQAKTPPAANLLSPGQAFDNIHERLREML